MVHLERFHGCGDDGPQARTEEHREPVFEYSLPNVKANVASSSLLLVGGGGRGVNDRLKIDQTAASSSGLANCAGVDYR